ncbi:MAG: division/cell wall cluster transcriptional repressor MraZ [Acutalibacteraceae bacterium]
MFSGMTYNSIDSKGRIILPTKLREGLGESFMVTNGFQENLQIMSLDEFAHLSERIKELPMDKAMAMQYIIIGPAVEVSPNSQGRIQIPQSLRENASLSKDAVVIGMDKRVEVWDKEKYEKFIERQKREVFADAVKMLKL